jgi:NAD(P)-dependent dehydrogenase (short-subunit alcohol dehydrogenase family)
MDSQRKTAIVTGASQGIGAGIVRAFAQQRFNVVANSRKVTQITQHLAMEYAKDGIRVNAVAPGAVYTPLHQDTLQQEMESLSPMGRPSTVGTLRMRSCTSPTRRQSPVTSCTSMAALISAAW